MRISKYWAFIACMVGPVWIARQIIGTGTTASVVGLGVGVAAFVPLFLYLRRGQRTQPAVSPAVAEPGPTAPVSRRGPLLRPRSGGELAPFERLKSELEGVDCDPDLLWRPEIRRLPSVLADGETMELIVACGLRGDAAVAVVTDRRLLVVSERVESLRHGRATELEAVSNWAGDVKIRFVHEGGELVLEDLDEADARRLYSCLRERERVPSLDGRMDEKLGPPPGVQIELPWMTAGTESALRRLRRRWVLKALDEAGPRRRSFAWLAHAGLLGAAYLVAAAVLCVILLVVAAVIALFFYA